MYSPGLPNENIPLLLPANLKAANVRIIPNTSWERSVVIFPWVASGRCKVIRDPEAVTICCSFVPANCPRIACVIEVGGCMVREYMNIDEVVAMAQSSSPKAISVFAVTITQLEMPTPEFLLHQCIESCNRCLGIHKFVGRRKPEL